MLLGDVMDGLLRILQYIKLPWLTDDLGTAKGFWCLLVPPILRRAIQDIEETLSLLGEIEDRLLPQLEWENLNDSFNDLTDLSDPALEGPCGLNAV